MNDYDLRRRLDFRFSFDLLDSAVMESLKNLDEQFAFFKREFKEDKKFSAEYYFKIGWSKSSKNLLCEIERLLKSNKFADLNQLTAFIVLNRESAEMKEEEGGSCNFMPEAIPAKFRKIMLRNLIEED